MSSVSTRPWVLAGSGLARVHAETTELKSWVPDLALKVTETGRISTPPAEVSNSGMAPRRTVNWITMSWPGWVGAIVWSSWVLQTPGSLISAKNHLEGPPQPEASARSETAKSAMRI